MKKIIVCILISTITINAGQNQKTGNTDTTVTLDTKTPPTTQKPSSTEQLKSFCKKYGITLLAGGAIGAVTGTILNIYCTEYIYTKHKSDKYRQDPAIFFIQLFTQLIAMNITESLMRIGTTHIIQMSLDEDKIEHDKMAMQLAASAASWATFLLFKSHKTISIKRT